MSGPRRSDDFLFSFRQRHMMLMDSVLKKTTRSAGYRHRWIQFDNDPQALGTAFAFTTVDSDDWFSSDLSVGTATTCLGIKPSGHISAFIRWFFGARRYSRQPDRMLTVGGAFPTIVPFIRFSNGSKRWRLHDHIDYDPSSVTIDCLPLAKRDIRELGLLGNFPGGKNLFDAFSLHRDRKSPLEILLVTGERRFRSLNDDQNTFSYPLQLVTTLEQNRSDRDDALLRMLMPPNALLPTGNATHPCICIYILREDGTTETRFVFVSERPRRILAFGTLSSRQVCPIPHPPEFLDGIERVHDPLRFR